MVMHMNRNSIRWRLPASYALIALVAAISLGSMMLLVLRDYYANQEREYLLGNAVAIQPVLEQILQSDLTENSVQDQIEGLAFLSQTQIRLLDAAGNVIADSGTPNKEQVLAVAGAPASGMVMFSMPVEAPVGEKPTLIYGYEGSFVKRVEPFEKQLPASKADILLPLSASPYGYGFVSKPEFDLTRRSSQVVSIPLGAANGMKLGSLEFLNGPSYGADVIESVTNAWLAASVFAVAVAALAGWFMSKRVTGPVLALERATRQMEQGDLRARVELEEERQEEFLSLANSFNGMAAQVERTVSTLREFVADAAHELHTPLTALQANIELARNEKDAASHTHYLSRALEQSRRLEDLVQSLLDLSRIEAAESQWSLEPVNLVQVGREIGEQFASRAEQADRLFSMVISKDELPVLGNETQLKQAILNLLENALKFTPQNGSISLTLEQVDDEARLTIRDTGIGIPPEDLPHLFERFHRGRNTSEYEGNGLGLAIVKAIVTGHGGNVTIESQPGEGTQVRVSTPVAHEK